MAKDRIPLPGAGEEGKKEEGKKTAFGAEGTLYQLQATPGIGVKQGRPIKYGGIRTYRVPGVARVTYGATCGISEDKESAVNIATLKVYKDMQAAMRNRTLPFSRAEIMWHLLSLDGIYAVYNDIARAVKTTITYSAYNKYIGKTLVKAMGYNYDDFVENRSKIIAQMAVWRETLKQFPLPAVFQAMVVHDEMSKYVYADGEDTTQQLYVCVPAYVYDYTGVDAGNGLAAYPIHDVNDDIDASLMTWNDIKAKMAHLIAAIEDSTFFDVINAAFITTYGDKNVIELDALSDTDSLQPYMVYNALFLAILNNATIYPLEALQSYVPTEDRATGTILSKPYVVNVGLYGDLSRNLVLANVYTSTPSAGHMTQISRWHADIEAAATPIPGGNTSIIYYRTCGPELIFAIDIIPISPEQDSFSYTENSTNQYAGIGYNRHITHSVMHVCDVAPYDGSNHIPVANQNLLIGITPSFKGFPIIYGLSRGGDGNLVAVMPHASWHYVSTFEDNNLSGYHDAILWRQFAEFSSSDSSRPSDTSEK